MWLFKANIIPSGLVLDLKRELRRRVGELLRLKMTVKAFSKSNSLFQSCIFILTFCSIFVSKRAEEHSCILCLDGSKEKTR